MTEWHFDSGRTILDEQRRLASPGWRDFPTRLPSAPPDPAGHPVQVLAAFTFRGEPIVWFVPDRSAAVVDPRVFSDLVVVDAAAMGSGSPVARLGTVTADARAELGDVRIVQLLVSADAIRTFWHEGSRVCLDATGPDAAGAMRFSFSGEHRYYTNEENVGSLAFTVWIHPDGAIDVGPR